MYTLEYSSTRSEVWRWYWRAWAAPRGLWAFHVVIALALAVGVWLTGASPTLEPRSYLGTVAPLVIAAFIFMVLWPQLRFKAKARTLKVDAKGWSTQIGSFSGSRSWANVRAVEDAGDAIVIVSSNRSALIVPNRAFGSNVARAEFLGTVRRWHKEANASVVSSAGA